MTANKKKSSTTTVMLSSVEEDSDCILTSQEFDYYDTYEYIDSEDTCGEITVEDGDDTYNETTQKQEVGDEGSELEANVTNHSEQQQELELEQGANQEEQQMEEHSGEELQHERVEKLQLLETPLRRVSSSPPDIMRPIRTRLRSNAKANFVTTKFGHQLTEIPPFVITGFEYLRQNSLHLEGLFRVQGSHNELETQKAKLNSGQCINYADCKNAHTAPALIKMYFRELPVPLCTFDCYDMFVLTDAIPIPEVRLDCLKKVLSFIPATNIELLSKLCCFLTEVASCSKVNKMTPKNLAIVFSPNLLRPDSKPKPNETPQSMMVELQAAQNVICSFIENSDFFFISDKKTYAEYLESKTAPIPPEPSEEMLDTPPTTPVTPLVNSEEFIDEIKGDDAQEVTQALERVSFRLSVRYGSETAESIHNSMTI